MITNIKKWYKPDSIEETVKLLSETNSKIYAGGTGFHRNKISKPISLIDIRKLKLNYAQPVSGGTLLGSSRRFSDIAKCQCTDGREILRDAVKLSGSPALRNLITIGGSMVSPPSWGNLPTALLALDATITIQSPEKKTYTIQDFLETNPLKKQSIITEFFIPEAPGFGKYFRLSKTKFDYSSLDIAVYIQTEKEMIQKTRISVGNIFPKAKRLITLEKELTGLNINDDKIQKFISDFIAKSMIMIEIVDPLSDIMKDGVNNVPPKKPPIKTFEKVTEVAINSFFLKRRNKTTMFANPSLRKGIGFGIIFSNTKIVTASAE